jgi:cytochrome P450
MKLMGVKMLTALAGSHFLTADHGLHRMRRKPLEPFFSRAGVQRLHTMLGAITLKLEERLKSLTGTGKVVHLDHVFNAFSGDVISQIFLGSSSNTAGFLDDPEFSPGWYALRNKSSLRYGLTLKIGTMLFTQLFGRFRFSQPFPS